MPPVGLLTPVTVGEYSRGTAARIGALSTATLLIGLPLSDIAYGQGVGYHLVVTLLGAAVVLIAAWTVPWDDLSPRFLLVWPVLVLVSILVWSTAGPRRRCCSCRSSACRSSTSASPSRRGPRWC